MAEERPKVDLSTIVPRIAAGIIGFSFAAIGITVIVFLWLAPYNEFASPPLFFRVFGSLIALTFVAVGGMIGVLAIFGSKLPRSPASYPSGSKPANATTPPPMTLNYGCPKCGGQLGQQADVSPLGDVKCSFCNQWFNIHQPPTTT